MTVATLVGVVGWLPGCFWTKTPNLQKGAAHPNATKHILDGMAAMPLRHTPKPAKQREIVPYYTFDRMSQATNAIGKSALCPKFQ